MRSFALYVFSFLLLSFSTFAQTKKIDSYVRDLNNSQFIIIHPEKANFKMKSKPALKLIKIGKPATGKLLEALNDSSKTIMAHLVLCHIYFKHVSFAGPKHQAARNNEFNKYYLGEEYGEGLLITEEQLTENSYRVFVTNRDKEKVIEYWKKKIAN